MNIIFKQAGMEKMSDSCRKRICLVFCLLLGVFILPACSSDDDPKSPSAFALSSSASEGGFDPEGTIPDEFKYNIVAGTQCTGMNHFPKLLWGNNPPAGTESFVLIVDDPDGGDWVHLNLYDIPKSRTGIPRLLDSSPIDVHLTFYSDYGTAGMTSNLSSPVAWWGQAGWGGPCPPSGTHTYYFKLYAMNVTSLGAVLNNTTRSAFESGAHADKIIEIDGEKGSEINVEASR